MGPLSQQLTGVHTTSHESLMPAQRLGRMTDEHERER